MDAFNNFSYREPDEEEMKESKKIADSYMEYQEKEEKEWFIEQEKELLQSLIKDCQLDEYLGEGVLDEETLKMIYETSDSSPTASQASTNPSEDSKQDFPIIATKKNKGRRNRKKKTPEKLPPEMPVNNDKPFDETNIAEEAVDFANDASLQFLINQQILAEQEQKMLSEYQYNQSEFPSLVAGDDLKQIKRKKAFAINEWTKTKGGQSSTGCGDDLEEEQIKKIKKAFPAINTDI
uniref:Uncharacterized protein n=1 Tax=Euplotes crassus TaxID=5936 RepID=A0A7S3KRQ1_EUPCR|mmetsp:Transcript_4730/g.4430  ORF Transcript_4730/g.4430 Transcript_4730/m.4430 type:complete len:236 (+) Transcript_4730:201-908(+)